MLHAIERERIVAGGHRRVRREDRRAAHRIERLVEGRAFGHQLVDALEHDERRRGLR